MNLRTPSMPDERVLHLTRRHFFGRGATGIGLAALTSICSQDVTAVHDRVAAVLPHFSPKAKRVIYLFQSGGPSHMDLFDHKPQMEQYFDSELPDDVRMGQRITTMTSRQKRFPVAPSVFRFRRHGHSGALISDLLPYTATVADELCFVKSMVTEAINHDPAITFFQTGTQLSGRPSIGSWFSYGLGSENTNLPHFIAMTSQGTGLRSAQPLYDRLWGSGFLPTTHQGVKLRSSKDPVLYLNNPAGISPDVKRALLDDVAALNRKRLDVVGDPEIATRIAQYEMAFRMQTSIPGLIDFSDEPRHVIEMYGPEVHTRGSYASNCLLARRLSERGVRFVQLFHKGWDQHSNLPKAIRAQCKDTDQPSAALVQDLRQQGLLDETLVIWGGEFGRTTYCQGELSRENYGRDHHPRCFTIWMAGGGIRPGMFFGETDDFSYNVTANPVQVHDLHATMLHLMGIDHRRLIYRFQGRNHRLTDVHGDVVQSLLA